MTAADNTDPADVLDDDLLVDDQKDDGAADLVADDHDGQAQDYRLTEILKTRRKVLEHRTQLRHALHRGDITQYRAETEYRDILESYLIDLEPVFVGSDKADVWDTEAIDTWQMTVEATDKRATGPAFDTGGYETYHATVEGLRDVLELPNPITITGKESTNEMSTRAPGTVKHEFQIPFGVLDQVFRTANRALNDWGLELQLQPDDTDEWEV